MRGYRDLASNLCKSTFHSRRYARRGKSRRRRVVCQRERKFTGVVRKRALLFDGRAVIQQETNERRIRYSEASRTSAMVKESGEAWVIFA